MDNDLIRDKNWWQTHFKWIVPLVLFALLGTGLFSITTGLRQKKHEREHGIPFDKTKWMAKADGDYPYRNKMLKDLTGAKLYHLKALSKDEILSMLGEPDRIDNNYFFYRITRERVGLLTLHLTTLVIKIEKDGNTVLIHE